MLSDVTGSADRLGVDDVGWGVFSREKALRGRKRRCLPSPCDLRTGTAARLPPYLLRLTAL